MACIYCGAEPADSREHWFPRSLGSFRGAEPIVGYLCTPCNTQLGREVDQDLARASPEAFFRTMLAVPGRRRADAINPFYYRAGVDQPVSLTGRLKGTDYEIGFEITPDDPLMARVLTQVVLCRPDGQTEFLPVPPAWDEERFAAAVVTRGWAEATPIACYARDEAEGERLGHLLRHAFPRFDKVPFYYGEGERGDLAAQFRALVSVRYVRALAKLAFHYALRMCPMLDGAAAAFEPLRRFIGAGEGDWQHFVSLTTKPFVGELALGYVPRDWGHFLAVEATYEKVIVAIQFFVGPRYIPPVWVVHLGPNPCRLDVECKRSHCLRYFREDEPKDGFDGEMTERVQSRLILLR